MDKCIHRDFLASERAYSDCVKFWRDLVDSIAAEVGEEEWGKMGDSNTR